MKKFRTEIDRWSWKGMNMHTIRSMQNRVQLNSVAMYLWRTRLINCPPAKTQTFIKLLRKGWCWTKVKHSSCEKVPRRTNCAQRWRPSWRLITRIEKQSCIFSRPKWNTVNYKVQHVRTPRGETNAHNGSISAMYKYKIKQDAQTFQWLCPD